MRCKYQHSIKAVTDGGKCENMKEYTTEQNNKAYRNLNRYIIAYAVKNGGISEDMKKALTPTQLLYIHRLLHQSICITE